MSSRVAHTGIAVLEARWWAKSNLSVRPLFDLIADIHCSNPHAYHYEMINSEAAAKEAIPRIGRLKHCKYLYIAAHGDADGIYLGGDERLSRTELKNRLNAIEGSKFVGLYLGACSFGTKVLADHLFSGGVSLRWIAGYSKSPNWIDSSSLDLLFFNALLKKPRKGDTSAKHFRKVARRIATSAGGLTKALGFGLYGRSPKTGKARDILAI